MSSKRLGTLMAGLLTMMTLPAAAQKTYTVTDLGVLRGGSARIHSVNSKGEAVGGSGFVYGADRHAFFWSHGGGMRELARLGGGDISEAFAINDSGVVVGSSNTATSTEAFRWTRTGGLQNLPLLPGANSSQAYAINANGDIAGLCGTHAALWSGGKVTDLGGLPGSDWSEAHGINIAGEIVGYSTTPAGGHAVRWNHGVIEDLGVLPGDASSRANLINDAGTVVGSSLGESGARAFVWTAAKGMQPLPMLGMGEYSEAFGINSAGQIVGASGGAMGTRAVLWTPGAGAVDLNTLLVNAPATLVLTSAFSINDAGQIVAFGISEQNTGRDQESQNDREMHHAGTRVFLLTPQ